MKAPKRLSSGKYVDLANLEFQDIDIFDISRALNTIYRFTGHWKDKKPLTVAQHTALVCFLCDELFVNEQDVLLDCLIHDWPEAYYGDIATPLKHLFKSDDSQYIKHVDKLVYDKFYTPYIDQIGYTEETYTKRKTCDLLSLDIERRNMWSSQHGKSNWPEVPKTSLGYTMKEKEELFDEFQNLDLVDLESMYESIISKISSKH